jgi:hypothetical protein
MVGWEMVLRGCRLPRTLTTYASVKADAFEAADEVVIFAHGDD